MSAERIVILGASGFFGTRLVRHALKGGAAKVVAIDIEPPRERLDGADYHTVDVRRPIDPALGEGASVIFNFAAVHRTPGHPEEEYYETNVAGALNATALADACDIRTIVFTSSIAVYGPSEQEVVEDTPLKPTTAYGRSKRLAEQVHQEWLRQGEGRRLIVVRPGVTFGPGERGNYTRLAKALKKGYFFYPGRRDTVKSGGYIDELLRTFEFALKRNEPSILYNFAYPGHSTTEDIVKAFAQVMDQNHRPLTLPVTPLLAAAGLFEICNALGLKNTIHRERVMKLVKSTKVRPGWLLASGYEFATDLKGALTNWRDESAGSFD